MLYMTLSDGRKLVVLETGNLEKLKEGKPAVTPDGQVFICWTPDAVWLGDQIAKSDGEIREVHKLIEESLKRPEARKERPYHKPEFIDFKKKRGNGDG